MANTGKNACHFHLISWHGVVDQRGHNSLSVEEELKCVTLILTLGRILHNEPKWEVRWHLRKGSRLVLSRSRVLPVGVLKCRDR
jgi:hypothetical protein